MASNTFPVKCFINLLSSRRVNVRFLAKNYHDRKTLPVAMLVNSEVNSATTSKMMKIIAVSKKKMLANNMTFHPRSFSSSKYLMYPLKPEDLKKRVDNLTDCFTEARELLGDARESLGSTYFSDDMMEAQEAVSTTVSQYQALLAELGEDQRNDVIRTIGLRMEELKAQEQAIKDLLD